MLQERPPDRIFHLVRGPARIPDQAKRNAMIAFLKWMPGPGQRQAAALGYVALPAELAAREEAAILNIR